MGGILIGIIIPGQSGSGSNGNEEVLHITQHLGIEASESDAVCMIFRILVGLSHNPLVKCNRSTLQPKYIYIYIYHHYHHRPCVWAH